jgi:hypothetical protein
MNELGLAFNPLWDENILFWNSNPESIVSRSNVEIFDARAVPD